MRKCSLCKNFQIIAVFITKLDGIDPVVVLLVAVLDHLAKFKLCVLKMSK